MKTTFRRFLTSKLFLIPVAALVMYTVAGFFAAPAAFRWYVPRYAVNQLKCKAGMGKVRINPYLFTFEINDFSLKDPGGNPLVMFSRLFVDFEMTGLFHWTAGFRDIRLEKPSLYVVFGPDGAINLARLVPQSSAAPKESKSKPFGMILRNVAITGGQVAVSDRRQSKPAILSFHDLNLNLKDISTIQNRNGTYSFTASTPEQEAIQWQGDISLVPFHSKGKIAFKAIQARTLWNFQRDTIAIEPPAGKLDLSADYRLDTSGSPLQLTLDNFQVDLTKMSLKLTGANKPAVELNKLTLTSMRLDLAARMLKIGKLLLDGGNVQLVVDEAGRSNLEKVVRKSQGPEKKQDKLSPLPPAPPAKAVASSPGQSPWTVNADAIEVKNLGFSYDDASRLSPLKAGVSSIAVSCRAKIKAGAPGTQVSVQGVSTELKEVEIGSPQTRVTLFRTGKLIVQGGEFDSSTRTLTVSRIAVSDGQTAVSRDKDSRINWVNLFIPKGGDPGSSGSKPASGAEAPLNYLLKTIELSDFNLALSDQTVVPEKPLYILQKLNVRLTGVDGKSPMGFGVDLQVKEGGVLSLHGTVNPKTGSATGDLKVTGLVLTPLQPYLEPHITLVLRSAAFSTQGAFRYGAPDKGADMAYEGAFSLNKLSLTKPDSKKTYLGCDAMSVSRLKLTLKPDKLEVREIRLSQPVCELIIAEDRTVNLSKILKKQAGQKEPSKASKTASSKGGTSFPFSIGKVRIEKGKMLFADFSQRPQFMTRIHSLKGTVGKLSSEKDTLARIRLDGGVDQYGMARIEGALDLYNIGRSTDITMALTNVEMTSLTPYSGRFAGRTIKSGKLSMDLKYKIQNNKLLGDNKIIVDNLVLGEKVESPDAVNLPLNLAVALLKDSNGRIDIGLPVSGDINDPQFKLGPLIWKALVNLLTKVVTSPFRALGSLFGGQAAEFKAVEFDPGKADLLPPEKEKLKKIADMMKQRPQIKLSVQGGYSSEADGLRIKKFTVRRAVASQLGQKLTPDEDPGPPDFDDSKTREVLEEMYRARFGDSALKELEQGVKQGTIKPRVPADTKPEEDKGKKEGVFSKVFNELKLYKIVPGAMSPEQSEGLARELYARLVESEPVSDKILSQLAQNRAQAVITELESAGGVPKDRLASKPSAPLTGKTAPSATFSLDALSGVH
jgi:hypothetical protein